MNLFETILINFKLSIVFRGSWGNSVNWLEPKAETPYANLTCPNPKNALYNRIKILSSFRNVSSTRQLAIVNDLSSRSVTMLYQLQVFFNNTRCRFHQHFHAIFFRKQNEQKLFWQLACGERQTNLAKVRQFKLQIWSFIYW